MQVKSPLPGSKYEVDYKVAARQRIELHIVKLFLKAALSKGYYISVNDGEELVLKRSKDQSEILKAMFSTDEEYLYVVRDATPEEQAEHGQSFTRVGTVYLIYGNDGYDVIVDHSTSLEPLMKEISEYQTKHGY